MTGSAALQTEKGSDDGRKDKFFHRLKYGNIEEFEE